MKRKIEIPVEPLSEARWAKIDDAVMRALDAGMDAPRVAAPSRTRARSFFIAAAGIVAAAAAIFFVLRGAYGPREGAFDTSHIETGEAASHVALGFASLDVGPASALTTSGDEERGMVVVLERGSVECEVAPRRGRAPFVVQAGSIRVRVVGTRFVVRRTGDHDVAVEVRHGVVEVSSGGKTSLLKDGERWPSEVAAPSAPTPSAPTAEPPPSNEHAALAVPTEPAPSHAAPSSNAKPPATADRQAFEQAARNEGRDPEGSMTTYRRLANSGGPWAPNALFAAGRLAGERGQRTEARRLLEQYLARYPSGGNAEDARQLLGTLR